MTQSNTSDPTIAVIVPAYNAAQHLRANESALRSLRARATLIVVDAGSTDETRLIAKRVASDVVGFAERQGPAAARNLGASRVSADVLLFLDADCTPLRNTLARVASAFAGDPQLVSLTGSYDDAPPETNFASQYMNLRHHYTHQNARREPGTFWAGCGAVRRKVFLEVGGFDAERFPRPAIEDIELATRLQPLGRTRLDPQLQVKHLKRWSLWGVVKTDLFDRCIPWARLVSETGEMPDDLNLRLRQRVAVALSPLALLAVGSAPWALFAGAWPLLSCAGGVIAASVALDFGLFRFFVRQRGVGFGAGAWLFHQLHLFYSGATFAGVLLFERLRRSAKSGWKR